MTLKHIIEILLSYFSKETNLCFDLDKNIPELLIINDLDDEVIKMAVLKGLEFLEKENVLVKTTDTCYILTKPLEDFPQNVVISGELATGIAGIVNSYAETMNNDYRASAHSITERDLFCLIEIMNSFGEETEEDDD